MTKIEFKVWETYALGGGVKYVLLATSPSGWASGGTVRNEQELGQNILGYIREIHKLPEANISDSISVESPIREKTGLMALGSDYLSGLVSLLNEHISNSTLPVKPTLEAKPYSP